jgi:hypothetical protein
LLPFSCSLVAILISILSFIVNEIDTITGLDKSGPSILSLCSYVWPRYLRFFSHTIAQSYVWSLYQLICNLFVGNIHWIKFGRC